MIAAHRLADEARGWNSYAAPLSELRNRLVEEFKTNATVEAPTLLATFSCDRGSYALILPAGTSHPQLVRAEAGWDTASVVLDFATEPPAGPEFLLGGLCLDAAGHRVAYTVDGTGDDRYVLRLKDLSSAEASKSLASATGAAVTWERWSDTIVYTEVDETLRPSRVQSMAPDGSGARLIYQATDESEYLDLSVAGDGRTVFIAQERHSSRGVLRLDGPSGRVESLWDAKPGERVFADAAGDRTVLLRTQSRSAELLIGKTETTTVQWSTLSVAPPDVHWDEFALLDDAVLVAERHGGGQRCIRISTDTPSTITAVSFEEDEHCEDAAQAASLSLVPGFRTAHTGIDLLRGTWRTPSMWFRTTPDGKTASPNGSPPKGAGHPDMEVVSLTAISQDGTHVPLTILRPRQHPRALPTVLYAYGSYGVPVDPAYSCFRTSLLDRGVAFAVAHVRGGGDRGPQWHEAGRRSLKPRAVEDYLACAKTLVEQGWTPERAVVARARSAGAAIVGAAVNHHPGRFAAVVLEAPFVDCLSTLSDPEAPLTPLEWDEWGNPLADASIKAMLAALSPVDNVHEAPYPPILLTTGLADSRVRPQEAVRYADAVRANTTLRHPVLLKIDDSGHLGHSEVEADRRDEADVLAFILHQLHRAHFVPHPRTKSTHARETHHR